MRYLLLDEVIELHARVMSQSGGAPGVRDMNALDSALVQPQMSFGGKELHPTIAEKAAALCYSLVMNHPFVDGNKRVGHAATETFLVLNGWELDASVDESEQTIMELAASTLSRQQLLNWISARLRPMSAP
jgi:death-on-curing protein